MREKNPSEILLEIHCFVGCTRARVPWRSWFYKLLTNFILAKGEESTVYETCSCEWRLCFSFLAAQTQTNTQKLY